MKTLRYTKGDEDPLKITWPKDDGTLYDFSSGFTFRARIGNPAQAALVQKTTGFTGAATAPNLTVAWAVNELNAIPAGSYHLDVTATTAANIDVTNTWVLQILDGVNAP
jgi:hypothetical protein